MKKLLLLISLGFFGCTKLQQSQTVKLENLTAPEVVKTFVQLSGAAKTLKDKKTLLETSGGNLRRAFERMSDEEFKLTYLSGQLKIEKVDILDTVIQNERAKVRYQVAIENSQGTETTHETNEREAELKKGPSGWVIELIRLKGSDKIAFTRGMIF
ncbi:MAG: DUF1131 domain-containing protein [Deltaproteobacteria bacterium]|nr:DUF1131 domain-containing protein [Deltaproteobacteria bacterium]